MLVAATIGHAGRPGRWADRGAAFNGVEEASVVRRYTDALDQALRRRGHDCLLLSDGAYAEQWARADGYGAAVYLNCHVNAGGGDRGLILFDHRSNRGQSLARAVAGEMTRALPWTVQDLACRPDTNGLPRDADFSEAFATIAGVRAVALCLEPYFLDGPRRLAFLDQLALVGEAIASGLHEWAQGRG
jgi:N-acetylmuramoyl-L-alanine amidase